jgi:hypothetical protein
MNRRLAPSLGRPLALVTKPVERRGSARGVGAAGAGQAPTGEVVTPSLSTAGGGHTLSKPRA